MDFYELFFLLMKLYRSVSTPWVVATWNHNLGDIWMEQSR